MHRDLLLPCGFLPESKEPEPQPATPACRPQTRSLRKLVVDPGECLSEEEEEGRLPQGSILPTVKFTVDGTCPAQSSSTIPAVAESVHSPSKSTLGSDPVDQALEQDVSGESEEENGEYLPEPKEISSAPELLPPEGDVELGGSVETSIPDDLTTMSSPHATETPVANTNSGGGDGLDTFEPVQRVHCLSRQPQPPKHLQYSGLGTPLISVVQTLFHSLADAYGEAFAVATPDTAVVSPRVHMV